MSGGELIRRARRQAGLTQAQLARRMGTSQSVLVRWERGQRSPTFDTVLKAVRACGFRLRAELEQADPGLDRLIELRLAMSPLQRVKANERLLEEARSFATAGQAARQ